MLTTRLPGFDTRGTANILQLTPAVARLRDPVEGWRRGLGKRAGEEGRERKMIDTALAVSAISHTPIPEGLQADLYLSVKFIIVQAVAHDIRRKGSAVNDILWPRK